MSNFKPAPSSDSTPQSSLADEKPQPENGVPQHGPATKITTRSDRTTRTAFLQTSIRPVGTKLIAPKQALPPEPPQLRAPESVYDTCNVRQLNPEGINVRLYEINSRSSISTRENFIPPQIYDLRVEMKTRQQPSVHRPSEALTLMQAHEEHNIISKDFGSPTPKVRPKHIYYFAGGGWQTPPSKEHWKLCAHLANTLTERGHPTTVTLVSHPLAPNAPGETTLPILERLYYEILPITPPNSIANGAQPTYQNGSADTHLNTPPDDTPASSDRTPSLSLHKTRTRFLERSEDVIFAGDSSGGNVALSLVLNVLASNPHARVPTQLLLISPAVDLRNANPDILKAEKSDPLMNKRYIDSTARAWAGDDRANPQFSPLLRDIGVLRERGVVVNGVIGLADVLAPDARKFVEKCEKEEVSGSWLIWERQMHCFPLAFSYKMLPECTEAVEWMVERLMEGRVRS